MSTRAMRTSSLIAECNLFYTKIVSMRAMRARSLIAECNLFYTKNLCIYIEKIIFAPIKMPAFRRLGLLAQLVRATDS